MVLCEHWKKQFIMILEGWQIPLFVATLDLRLYQCQNYHRQCKDFINKNRIYFYHWSLLLVGYFVNCLYVNITTLIRRIVHQHTLMIFKIIGRLQSQEVTTFFIGSWIGYVIICMAINLELISELFTGQQIWYTCRTNRDE